jgi:hypothetical protein
MSAAVRLGSAEAYALIVFNETSVPVDYQIEVKGANLAVSDEPVDSDNMMLSNRQTSEKAEQPSEFAHDHQLITVVSP